MAYSLPPNGLIRSLVMGEGAKANERRRKVYQLEADLEARDWLTVDPGRGPVPGWGGTGGRRR
jgi:hypothetical protein